MGLAQSHIRDLCANRQHHEWGAGRGSLQVSQVPHDVAAGPGQVLPPGWEPTEPSGSPGHGELIVAA